jgi:TonB family protein
MEPMLYLIKVNMALLLFYSLYRLFFQSDTFLQWKRFLLLTILIISFLYPFSTISDRIVSPEVPANGNALPVFYLNEMIVVSSDTSPSTPLLNGETIFQTIGLACFAVASFLLVRIILRIIAILWLVQKTEKIELHGQKIHVRKGLSSPFSFFGWIVLDPEKYPGNELKEILLHEKAHVLQKHSLDVIFAEIVCTFCWFNPFIHLLKKEICMNLEYLADRAVLKSGCEAKHYQFHLLHLTYVKATAKITNNFNVSPLKKRIIMMNSKQTSLASIWKYTLLIPAFAFLVFFNYSLKAEIQFPAPVADAISELVDENAQDSVPVAKTKKQGITKKNATKSKPPVYETRDGKKFFTMLEEPPVFPGGEKALMKYISDNLKYPETAIEACIQGRVVLRFIITTTGKVENVEVMRSLDAACDAEAVRVVEAMPAWTPGKQDGEAQSVYYTLPVSYKLQPSKSKPPVYETIDGKKVFIHLDEPPVFPGGVTALMKYLSDNVKYPETAIQDSIQGRVVLRFIITTTGKVENVEVVRSLNAACDAEAVRVVEAMPA